MRRVALFLTLLGFFGCTTVNFSLVNPAAKDFHPRTVASLPPTVGEYEAARDVVDVVIAKGLIEKGQFENVLDAATIKTMMESSPELINDVSTYIQRVNTLGVSDKALASRLRDALKTDAFFLTYVTAWGYGRMEGSKVGRVGLGVKLVDPSTGTIMWKANHDMVKDYWFFKPKLNDMAGEVLAILLKEMPHFTPVAAPTPAAPPAPSAVVPEPLEKEQVKEQLPSPPAEALKNSPEITETK